MSLLKAIQDLHAMGLLPINKDTERQEAEKQVIDSARAVSKFVKSNEYPEMFSPQWSELTMLLDAQDTAIRKLDKLNSQ